MSPVKKNYCTWTSSWRQKFWFLYRSSRRIHNLWLEPPDWLHFMNLIWNIPGWQLTRFPSNRRQTLQHWRIPPRIQATGWMRKCKEGVLKPEETFFQTIFVLCIVCLSCLISGFSHFCCALCCIILHMHSFRIPRRRHVFSWSQFSSGGALERWYWHVLRMRWLETVQD